MIFPAASNETKSRPIDRGVTEYFDSPVDVADSRQHCGVTIPLTVEVGSTGVVGVHPVSVGFPLPPGTMCESVVARLYGPEIKTVPVQIEPIVRWPDGSVQWLLADFMLPPGLEAQTLCSLELLRASDASLDRSEVRLFDDTGRRAISTGTHRINILNDELLPFSSICSATAADDSSYSSEFVLVDHRGHLHKPRLDRWRVESNGPVRLTLAAEGHFPGVRDLRLRMRESFYAGTGLVRLEVTLHNPHRARHRGGLWDLGDPGSVSFEDLSLNLSLPNGPRHTLAWSTNPHAECERASDAPFRLYQDSSGGEKWDSCNHVNRDGRITSGFRGYRMKVGDCQTAGERASPTLCVTSATKSLAVAFPEFWQQFPKVIAIEGDRLRIGLFPQEHNDLFELQGGEQKTHVFWLRFSDSESEDTSVNVRSMTWVHGPTRVRPTSEWCDASGALPQLTLPAGRSRECLDRLLEEACGGPESLTAHRERVDEYGWRNYGDVFADHEQLHYHGRQPLVSHYNNQFDMVLGFLSHSLRTDDRQWWVWGDALARHVADIDIYHTNEDKAAYNGGLFWFTDHYLHAHTSTHRTYSRCNRKSRKHAYGGGPSPEHNFTTGLLLHYCLTGNSNSRDAVISLADWVIGMDDGWRNILGVIDEGPTGRASGARVRRQSIGRAAGNSINALLDAWTLTSEPKYLECVETLIRRCIHPRDDIDGRELLDIEKNWSYTVFLKSLAKYLDRKAEAGQFDRMYAYAQTSFVNYARWMSEHERPYFDQVEKLEFPTEAWAAQELRKANVIRLAAPHVEEPLRTRLADRGDQLANRAWDDLFRFESRASARSLAIVMIEGALDCSLRPREIQSAPQIAPSDDFGEPARFLPQSRRVKLAATRPAAWAGLLARLVNPLRWVHYFRNRAGRTSSSG